MPRPIQATIHARALAHNLQRARQAVGGDARGKPSTSAEADGGVAGLAPPKVWAVVKANAYGHGIARVFAALSAADGFALLDLHEAVLLRELGWKGPILLLEGVFAPEDLDLCVQYDLWHTVHGAQQLAWLQAREQQDPRAWRHHVFLKLNGGMNRLGFAPPAFVQARQQLAQLSNVASVTLMMHFSDADAPRFGRDGIAHQMAVWHQTIQNMRVAAPRGGGMSADPQSLSNSAAILRYGASLRSDWVRAGIMLYGGAPDHPAHDANHWNLQAAMTLSARILAVQHLQRGDSVGYGSAFVADRPMRIGVVSCGYADGYPRHAPTGTPVLIDGVRTRVVGRVSMDMMTVDLTPVPQADCGSEVTLWGKASPDVGGATLAIDEVAHACGTVGYELMCALAPRVPVRVEQG